MIFNSIKNRGWSKVLGCISTLGLIGAGGVLGLSPVSESDEADLVGNWGDKD